jgi:hypothetical protein
MARHLQENLGTDPPQGDFKPKDGKVQAQPITGGTAVREKHCWHMLPTEGGLVREEDRCCYCNVPKTELVPDPNHGKFARLILVNHEGELCEERMRERT